MAKKSQKSSFPVSFVKTFTLDNLFISTFVTTFVTFGLINTAQGVTFVAPRDSSFTEGNSNNAAPFLFKSRQQQVFEASEFTFPSVAELSITQISFRPDEIFGRAFSATIPNIIISLSTTNAAVDGLSTVFDNNVGSDATVVYSGSLLLSSNFSGPLGGPKDFDITIDLQTPFLYKPTLGNLLLDVKNFSNNVDIPVFDAQDVLGDSTSRKWNDPDVNSPTSLLPDDGNPNNYANSLGLVVKFTANSQAVPEPSLFLGSVTALGVAAYLKRKFFKKQGKNTENKALILNRSKP